MSAHLKKCFLGGLVAILPVGALVILIFQLEMQLRPPLKDLAFYFPGLAIFATLAVIYLLGLTVTTIVGRWFWGLVERVISQVPGLVVLYNTLKQILGYGTGKDALFQEVVLVQDGASGPLEVGLVTGEVFLEGQPPRWAVFLPGAPNPAMGRMILVEPARCLRTRFPVDGALKALISTGKTGLELAAPRVRG